VAPDVVDAYVNGKLALEIKAEVEDELRDDLAGLQPEEAAVLAFLRSRLDLEVGRPDTPLNATAPSNSRRRTPERGRDVAASAAVHH
jgi:DNA topoisomerase-1